jgi:polar amino acid transport system substrate-binding protein
VVSRALLPASLLLASCVSGSSTLVVASDLDNPPFAAVDERGRPVGRDVEMMAEIAERLGRRIRWRRMPFEELLPAVESGQVDLVCATIGVTPERGKRVAFTRPYYRTVIAVVVRSVDGESTLGQLTGRRVAADAGTTSERAVRRHLPGAVWVFENPSGAPTAERLLRGEIDAAVMDGPAADVLAQEDGLTRLVERLDFESYALVLPKGRDVLQAELDVILERMERTGRLRAMNARHGL